jgi:hypothetical protein
MTQSVFGVKSNCKKTRNPYALFFNLIHKRKITLMKLSKEQLLGIVRHTLTFVGGIVVMKGLVDEATVTEITGGVLTLAGAIWSIIAKNKA